MNAVVTMSGTIHDNKTRWSHKEGLDCQEGDALIVCGYVAATGMPQSTLEQERQYFVAVLSTQYCRKSLRQGQSTAPQRGAG